MLFHSLVGSGAAAMLCLLVAGCGQESALTPPVLAEDTAPKERAKPEPSKTKTGEKAPATAKGKAVKPTVKSEPDKSEPAKSESAKPEVTKPAKSKPPSPAPLLKDWPKAKFALLLSGEEHGYFEPCGCSEHQLGGMARRGDLVKQIKARGWPVVGLDAGGIVVRPNRRQTQIKFEVMQNALKSLGYGALALGREELQLRPEFLLAEHDEKSLPYLGCNIVLFGDPDVGFPLRSTVIAVDEKTKIGVTAVFGPSYKIDVVPGGAQPNPNADVDIVDYREPLKKAIADLLAQKVELLVLISHARMEETKAIAKQFPQFHLILSTGGPEDPDPRPQFVGRTMIVTTGMKGKHVGVAGMYPEDRERPIRYELVDLDDERFQRAPEMERLMRLYQEQLQKEHLTKNEEPIQHPTGLGFAGVEKCAKCHKKAFAKWKDTKHAHAFETLEHGRGETDWIPRTFDPECLACHVVGWQPQEALRFKSGFVDLQTTPHLAGQQCENCHGPAGEHVKLEEEWKKAQVASLEAKVNAQRDAMHVDLSTADQMCRKCHDGDNSPKYDFDKYWDEVKHPGLD